MKTELQKKLLKKYPQFFTKDVKIYTGENSSTEDVVELLNQKEMVLPIQFGFECGDGWYMLLDELMAEIQNRIGNVDRNNKNVYKYNWMRKLVYKLQVRTSAKQKILRALGDWLYKNAPRKNLIPMTMQIDQIKEKFGGLRFYYSGGDEAICGMVNLAESLSYKICEDCGSTKDIGYTKGWITTMCKECYENHPRKDTLRWEPIKTNNTNPLL
jgi:hypothetical protein